MVAPPASTREGEKDSSPHPTRIAPRSAGILGSLECPLGLGLLRLATEGRPAEADALALIHASLDVGIRVLDTADVYSLSDAEGHYGERLVRQVLDSWQGPKEEVRVLTKVGLTRPKGRWLPNGRPDHIRKSVDASLLALGVERLFLLQLHARDPRVPFEETLAALAELQRAGKVEHLGLCNIGPVELRQAMRHFPVAAIQNELSVLNRKSATDGTLAMTREQGIPLLAHRPLGGHAKVARLSKNKILGPIAQRHSATSHEIALAALLGSSSNVVPLFGATRIESVRSSARALEIVLDVSDRTALDLFLPFEPTREALAAIAPPADPRTLPQLAPDRGPGDTPEVVILMGIQGAGKSQMVAHYVEKGYTRLNRDTEGGRLDDLVPRLSDLLAAGQKRVVMDNTYPSRISRASIVAAAHAHGVPVRCRHLRTPLAQARINVVLRLLDKYDRLLGPDEMKSFGKTDPNLPPPVALVRWVESFEPPQADEGFSAVDDIPFTRRLDPAHTQKGLLLDVDGTLRKTLSGEPYPHDPNDLELLPARRETLARWVDAGYQLFFVSNQSGIASGKVTAEAAKAAFERTIQLLNLPVTEVAYCPHPAFPVGCYCRKPLPGLGVYLMKRHRLAPEHLLVVGDMKTDAEFATDLGARFYDAESFFGLNGPKPPKGDEWPVTSGG
jgi:HAD superfamily hydrolase (TIGR01662 family)